MSQHDMLSVNLRRLGSIVSFGVDIVIENDRIQYYLTLKHELPSVEFKGPGKRGENPLFGKVVRAAIGMANRPGGGTVIIGVAEQATGLSFDGLSEEQLKTWKYEEIADGFNSYAEPPILFDRQEYQQDGNTNTFLILDIHEFTDAPVICKSEYKDKSNQKTPDEYCKVILRPGAFYARSVNKPETKEVLGIEGMRPMLQLAIDKGIRAFVAHAQLVGLPLSAKAQESIETLFAKQLEGWSSQLLDDIRSRGYWHVVIHPTMFEQQRIPLSELFPLIRRTSFDIRGWKFPYLDGGHTEETSTDWISSENEWDRILEGWRIYQSGQFVHESGIFDDWLDRSKHTPAGEHWRPGLQISVPGMVFRLTEFFEFAARLAVADTYRLDESLVVRGTLHNTKGRSLYDPGAYNGRLPMMNRHVTSAESIPFGKEFLKEEIVAQPWDLALDAAQYIFARFGWNPSKDLLNSIQSEIRPNWLKTDE